MDQLRGVVHVAAGGGSVAGDRVVQAGVLLTIVSLLPSLAPVLPPEATFTWADQYNDVPTLLVAVWAIAAAARGAHERRERTFWWLVLACPIAWLAVRVCYLVVPYPDWGLLIDQFSDASYLVGYLGVLLALEVRPHFRDQEPRDPRRMELLAVVGFAYFLLAYFMLAPSVLHPALYATWVPSMFLFATLDGVLLLRILPFLRGSRAEAWRRSYRWFAALFALWFAGDLVEGLMYMEVIPFVEPGTPWDILWSVPVLLLVGAARSRTRPSPSGRWVPAAAQGDVSMSK